MAAAMAPCSPASITAAHPAVLTTRVGRFLRNDLGIESPDGSSQPLHDHTTQYHGFAYLEDILDEQNRLSAVLRPSIGKFQIPNRSTLQPGILNADGTPLIVNGQSDYPSGTLDENQRELNHFAILSWQHSAGALDVQTSVTARYSSLTFTPDPSETCYSTASRKCLQAECRVRPPSDAAYKLNDSNTLRAGFSLRATVRRASRAQT